jgi:hypothetical protein
MIAATILRWICEPTKLEAIEGDLAELYPGRGGWRYLREVAGVCLRQPRTAVRSLSAAVLLLALTGRAGPPPHYTIHAHDPAGRFTLEFHRGRVITATLGGTAVPRDDVRQRGDTLVIRGGDNGADFYIAIHPERGGISWYPRQSPSSSR